MNSEDFQNPAYRALLAAIAASIPTYIINKDEKEEKLRNKILTSAALAGTLGYFSNDLARMGLKIKDKIMGEAK